MFHGSIVALVTPMLKNGQVDYVALERLVEWHLQNQTDGFVILGTTGESPTIEPDERIRMIQLVVAAVKGRCPVIIGTGTNCTHHTIYLTRQAMELGADAALLVTPYYNRPTQEGLFQHFKSIAQAVPLPQILYNVPSRTGCDLLPETIKRLDDYANIVAVKEASGDLTRLDKLLDRQMGLLTGCDDSAMEFILRGGKGVISVVANAAPRQMHLLVQAALSGDREQALQYNDQLQNLITLCFVETNPIPVKWILAEMGLIEEGIRLPLTPLAKEHHDQVREMMQSLEIEEK